MYCCFVLYNYFLLSIRSRILDRIDNKFCLGISFKAMNAIFLFSKGFYCFIERNKRVNEISILFFKLVWLNSYPFNGGTSPK